MITQEIKALFLMQAQDEISDGCYPTYSSHGEMHTHLEEDVLAQYAMKCDNYKLALKEVEDLDRRGY